MSQLSKYTEAEVKEKLKKVKAFIIDQDGTAYLEQKVFPWAVPFLKGLQERGIKYLFLSNNSSKSRKEHHDKLSSIGINVSLEHILSSADATIEYLYSLNESRDIYLMATLSVEQDFREAGFNLDSENPKYVVLAYDLTFNFQKLDIACRYIRAGLPFIATHEDNNWMIAPDDHMPDCGALAAAITAATKVKPKFVGKPNVEIVNAFLRRLSVSKDEVAIIGDRLNTDVRMGVDHDILTFLVLTGKTKREDIPESTYQPGFVVERSVDILDLFDS